MVLTPYSTLSKVVIGIPTAVQRLAILKAHTKTLPLSSDVDLVQLAEITLGYVGADLASLCREATLTALRTAIHRETNKAGPSESQGEIGSFNWIPFLGTEFLKMVIELSVTLYGG